MEYLYHYTNLETLALILKNKTIRFNSLFNVDDLEEAETKDMGKFGKYVYISCWTEDKEESIPLWNLYTFNMQGVRVGLPKNPFKKYNYKNGEYFFKEDVETYFDYSSIFKNGNFSVVPNGLRLIKIEYSDDDKKLFPEVKKESYPDATQDFLNLQSIDELKNVDKDIKVTYLLRDIGKYKRTNWSFQKEWRYIITTAPMGLKELQDNNLSTQQEYIRRMEDIDSVDFTQQLFFSSFGKCF